MIKNFTNNPSQTSLSKTIIIIGIFLFVSTLKLQAQLADTYNWKSVAIGGGGFVSAIIPSKIEEGLMYARTDVGGAYRLDAENNAWIPLLDWVSEDETGYLGVESLAIDPVEPNKLYMLVGISYFNNGKTAILRSEDYGNTFTIIDVSAQFKAHGNGMGRQTGERLMVDPNRPDILFCGTRSSGLFKSTDSGLTWNHVNSLPSTVTPNENGICFVVPDQASSTIGSPTQTLFLGVSRTGTNFYRTDDGGETFSAISGAPTNLMPQRAVLAQDNHLYVTYANGAGPHGHWLVPEPMDEGEIWKYNTVTEIWTNCTPSGVTRAFGGISVDPQNPQRILASTINTYQLQDNSYGDRIFLSTNGGTSWTDIVARGFDLDPNGNSWIEGHSIHWAGSIEFDPFNTKKAMVTSGNGIFKTEDIDATMNVWKFYVKGLEETVPLNVLSIPNGPMVSVIGDYDGFLHRDVDQYAPIHQPRTGTTTGLDYAALNANILLRSGNEMFYSKDMAQSWTEIPTKGKKGQVAVSTDGSTFLHCPEGSTTTYRSVNFGTSWSSVTNLNIHEARPVADPWNASIFYAFNSNNGEFLKSIDNGASFLITNKLESRGSKVIRTVPFREGDVWVPLYGGGLSRTKDSGETFAKIEDVTFCGAVGFGKEAPGKTFPTVFIWGTVNGTSGLYRSIDEGSSWERVNDDDHEYGGPGNGQFVVGDMNVYGRVYMSTAGRGIVYGESIEKCDPDFINPFVQVNGEVAEQASVIQVNQEETLILSPSAATEGSWSWTGPEGFTSNTREISFPEIQSEQSGVYLVQYTNTAGCTSSYQSFVITVEKGVTTEVSPRMLENTVDIYPNPSQDGRVFIQNKSFSGTLELEIFSIQGKNIYKGSLSTSSAPIHVSPILPAGAYVLVLKAGDTKIIKKLLVN